MNASSPAAQAPRFLRPLARSGIFCAILILLLGLVSFQSHTPALLLAYTAELRRSGLQGSSLAALLLATAGLTLSYMIVWARGRGEDSDPPLVSRVAGWPQSLLMLLFTTLAGLALWHFWPQRAAADTQRAFVIGGLSIVAAFPLLVCERFFDAVPRSQLPEGPDLKSLLFMAVIAFFGQGLVEIAAGLHVEWSYGAAIAIDCILIAAASELALRSLAIWFMPPIEPEKAHAAIASLALSLLRPGNFSPAVLGRTIKRRFGMDFSRSWALAYAREAAAPVLVGLMLFTWFLSGVVSIGIDARGSYERLSAPAEILKPGLHLLLPWPFGRVRRVEYGIVHSLSITDPQAAANQPGTPAAADVSRVEDIPPSSANRLWDQEQGSDISYIIASKSAGRESFEIANVNLRIVYRIGMDDASARQAIYNASDPKALVEKESGRMLAQFFAAKTLSGLMVEDRQNLAQGLRIELQQALDRLESGVEILDIVIESLRPPTGAAAAYHDVQAGAIIAAANIAGEKGRAETTIGLARQAAVEATNKSQAMAAEIESDANVELIHFEADAVSYKAAGHAFLLERYLSNLQTSLGQFSPGQSPPGQSSGAQSSLGQPPLEIIDHRLASPNAPVLDLRPAVGLTENLTGSERQTP